MATELSRHRFTVEEYEWMGRTGILTEDDRVELIEGEIVDMAPIGSDHAGEVAGATTVFVRGFGDVSVVWTQNPIVLGSHNEPQPDIALLKPRPDYYRARLPEPADVLLVIEVADTTLATDRRIKMPMYARAGIAEAWIIDVTHACIEVYREPGADGYQLVQTFRRGDKISLLAFPTRELDVAEILG